MKKVRVEVFYAPYIDTLEKEINNFLEENPAFEIKDIKYQFNNGINTAMIIYSY